MKVPTNVRNGSRKLTIVPDQLDLLPEIKNDHKTFADVLLIGHYWPMPNQWLDQAIDRSITSSFKDSDSKMIHTKKYLVSHVRTDRENYLLCLTYTFISLNVLPLLHVVLCPLHKTFRRKQHLMVDVFLACKADSCVNGFVWEHHSDERATNNTVFQKSA